MKVLLGSPERTRVEETDFLVDTGAYYTALPPKLTESLAIKPMAKVELLLADKRKAEAMLSYAYIKIGEREGVLPVAIMEAPEPLLGVTTLEGLGIKVDPGNRENRVHKTIWTCNALLQKPKIIFLKL